MINKLKAFFIIALQATAVTCYAASEVGIPISSDFNLPPAEVMEDGTTNPDAIRLMSFNIRVNHEQDKGTENEWRHRLAKVTYVINKYTPDIIALQEPNEDQLNDLKEIFGSTYSWIHARASDKAYANYDHYFSEQHRETQAIGIRNKRFKFIDYGRFWLSPDPEQEPDSPAWDGSIFTRVAIYAILQDKYTEKPFSIFNSHFDHVGIEARINSAHLMVSKATNLSQQIPFLITGDFNTFQSNGGPKVYEAFMKHKNLITDVRDAVKKSYGPISTWVGWDYNAYNERVMEELYPGIPSRWDHVFLSNFGICAHRTAVADERFLINWENEDKEVYPSDHRPIVVDFQIQ